MNLEISRLHVPLAAFALRIDTRLTAPVTGIFGASGAGKTSLIESIAGLRRPAAGKIVLDETVLSDAETGVFLPPEKRQVGYVPQDAALFVHLNVRENLRYSQRVAVAGSPRTVNYDHVIAALQITSLVSRRIDSLSGGERQRVAFGRALLANPRLLLLDEPLASLGLELRGQLVRYLQAIRDEFKVPMLYVSHSADEIVALCDEVIVLEHGQASRQGPTSALFEPSEQPHHVLAKSAQTHPVRSASR
ncbi:MAG: molybdenum transporter ATP-binding protein [Verrucomicrobia bacterium]|nr:molybdenum transporter ATP-binding protein [Verrucomicrobiota bacterium]